MLSGSGLVAMVYHKHSRKWKIQTGINFILASDYIYCMFGVPLSKVPMTIMCDHTKINRKWTIQAGSPNTKHFHLDLVVVDLSL